MHKTSHITYLGMMISFAMILSYVESLIPFYFGAPGIKLGLANLIVVIMLYRGETTEAFFINVIRIILVGFLFGNMYSILYGLSGGIISFAMMYFARRTGILSLQGVSILGGISHNIGQLCIAMFVVRTMGVAYYFPILLIGGLVTGFLIGIIAKETLKRIPQKENPHK